MEGFVRSEVPGLEGQQAREGSANASFLGAANHWHKRALEAEAKVNGDRRLVAAVALAIGAAAGFAAHVIMVMP